MFLNSFKSNLSNKTVTATKPQQILSYLRPTLSSSSHCRRYKSSVDIYETSSSTKSKSKQTSSSKKNFYESKILPLKPKFNSFVDTKSEVLAHENAAFSETATDDDTNTYDDDYIEVNTLNIKYGDDFTKLNTKTTKLVTKSNYSTNTQSRNGSALSIRNQSNLNASNASLNLKSSSKKIDVKKKFKNSMKRLMKPASLASNNNYNEINGGGGLELNTEIKHVRFTALLSSDAQLSLLKTYEDMIFIELSCIYPYIQTIPRTNTAKFVRNINKKKVVSNKEDEYSNRIRISSLFETAMKILDSIQKFKHKLNEVKETSGNLNASSNNKEQSQVKLNRHSSVCTTNSIVIFEEDEEDDPLEMYIKWLNLLNKEFV